MQDQSDNLDFRTQKFTNKATFIKEIGTDGHSLTVTFRKSNHKYRYDFENYSNIMQHLFDDINRNMTNFTDYAKSIENILQIAAKKSQSDNQPIRSVPRVLVKALPADANNEINISTIGYNQAMMFELEWIYSILETEVPEPLQQFICDRLNSVVFSQSMRYLPDSQEGIDYVCIQTNSEINPKMYFYTDHEMQGNFEIWYKALDPFIWYGKPA